MLATYWCNVNLHDKFFGYQPDHELVLVGTLEVSNLDDAFRSFNRIDATVPVLDAAEAPSMSVGDVIQTAADTFFTVARFGFDPIPTPEHRLYTDETVREVLDRKGF